MAYPDFKKEADGVREWSRDLRKLMTNVDKLIEANATAWTNIESVVDKARQSHTKTLETCGRQSREAHTLYLEMEDLRQELIKVEKTDKARAKEIRKEIDTRQKKIDAVREKIIPKLEKAEALKDTLKELGSTLKSLKSKV